MQHLTHDNHEHVHGEGCGHTRLQHGDHVDYLHDGHLHNTHGDHVDEHALDAPSECNSHQCGAHDGQHRHGSGCGHEAIPHAGHQDYLVDGHLHHEHEGHCDNHGNVATL